MIKLITFDCYGTLFDWIYGIKSVINYVLGKDYLDEFFNLEREELVTHKPYSQILKSCLRKLCRAHGIEYKERYGDALVISFAKSPPFPDVVPGLTLLKERGFRVGIISNTERKLIKITLAGMEYLIDYVVTFEDTGYYKPSHRAFTEALKLMGVSKDEVIHVSAYPYYDLIPAKELGIKTVMIDRYGFKWDVKVRNLEELSEVISKLQVS